MVVQKLKITPIPAATMAHSPPAVASSPEIVSDFAMTLPFEASKVSQELRAAVIKRTEDRWAWFSRAEDLDEERGTQLGTLGYLPWEIRQQIFGELFDYGFRQISWPRSADRRPIFSTIRTPSAWRLIEYPHHSSMLWMIRKASASLKFEVEFAFITTMNFDSASIEAIMYFLGCLTTCKNSRLRSITVPLIMDTEINVARKAGGDVCARLPAGHNSVEFELLYQPLLNFWPTSILERIGIPPKLVDSLEKLAQQIKCCWVARANTSKEYEKDTTLYEGRIAPTSTILGSTFRGLEAWSKDWLEWRATSREDDLD